MNRKVWMIILVFLLIAVATLSCAESSEIVYAPEQTVLTLEEYLAQGRETWFLTGKKEYTVQAEMVSGETSFHNELEVVDYTVTDDGLVTAGVAEGGEMQYALGTDAAAAPTDG